MKKITGFLIMAVILFLFPIQALAVDLTIDKTEIDAQLTEDGTVHVTESHTYTFEDEFNGITRSLIPKEGTSITDFSATENGTSLEVEQDEETFLVYRGGDDETITVELSYIIHDSLDVYEDMAQFYWPFFDSGNETDYENMVITVHPPQPTDDVIAYGFDEARGTETIQQEGSVTFQMGFVEEGKNGDVRVAYDRALFPAAAVTHNDNLRDEITRGQEESAAEEAAFLSRQDKLNTLAPFVIGAFAVFFFALLFYGWRRKKTTDHEAERIYHSTSIVPKAIMSIPATVYFYRNYMIEQGELLTIGMMDLVRKKNIEAKEDETYQLLDSNTDFKHESLLLQFLFKTIGKNDIFSFDQLNKYTKDTKNHSKFNQSIHDYQQAIVDEIETHKLSDKHIGLRWTTAIISLLLIPFMIFLGIHDLFMWVFFAVIVMFGLLFFSFIFTTRTPEGKVIKQRWKAFEKEFEEMDTQNWDKLPEEDKQRALIFSSGLKDQKLKERHQTFIDTSDGYQNQTAIMLVILLSMSTPANRSFADASYVSGATAGGSSSTFTGTGAGVGGGGGGSGGF